MQNPPPAQSAGGLDKRTGATLSYLLTWVTGIIFLFVGKNDPDVKYHASQSIVFFGGLTVIGIILSFIPGIRVLGIVINLVQVVGWIYCLWKAWTGAGARFQIPVVGGAISPLVEQLAGTV